MIYNENNDLLNNTDPNNEMPQYGMDTSIYSEPVQEPVFNSETPAYENDQIPVFKENGELNEMPSLVSTEPDEGQPVDLEEMPAYAPAEEGYESEVQPVDQPVFGTFEEPTVETPMEEPMLVTPMEEPVEEQPVVEDSPIVEETPVEEPTFEEPTYEEPVAEETPVEEPVYEEEEPTVAVDEPVTPTFTDTIEDDGRETGDFGADLIRKYDLLEEKIATNKKLIDEYNELAARVGDLKSQIAENDKEIDSGLGNAL